MSGPPISPPFGGGRGVGGHGGWFASGPEQGFGSGAYHSSLEVEWDDEP